MTRMFRMTACLSLLLVLAAGSWLMGTGVAHASTTQEKTYIEFIIDASGSMREKVDGGKSRMDIAKEVMKELVENLEDRPDLEIALRVYGFMLPGKSSCEDSGLLQTFGPVGKVRPSILKIVESLQPKGMTPISYSLEEAAKDFPAGKGGRNVIVLVTDGEESCGANPCVVSQKLQAQGLILKPYVVGFALTSAAEAKVSCIGNYFSAKDRESLVAAMKSIMEEVVSPPSLEVEAWAGETNVTARTNVEVLDAAGKPVKTAPQGPAGQVLKLTLAEGVYTVKGTLTAEGETLSASQPNVTLKKGETTRVRLDFAGLPGKIVLAARMGDRVVPASSLKAWAYSEEKGRKDFGVQQDRPAVAVAPGKYSVQCTYTGDPQQNRTVENVEVKAGETKEVAVTFDLPGKLRLKVVVDSKPSNEVKVNVHQKQKLYRGLDPVSGERGTFECGVLEGTYDIQVTPSVAGFGEQWVRDVKVKAGETVEKQVAFNPSKIRIKVTADGKPYHVSNMRLMLYKHDPEKRDAQVDSGEYVCDLELVEKGLFEIKMKEGEYDLLIINLGEGFKDKTLRKLEVKPGETLEKSIEIGGMGKIRVRVTSGGKPYSTSDMRLMLYEHDPEMRNTEVDSEEYVCDLEQIEKGLFENKVKEGLYDILAIHLGEGFPDKVLRKLEVAPGDTLEKSLDLGGMGRIRLRATWDGKKCTDEDIRVMLYYADTDDYICDLEMMQPGLFEAKVAEGEYDVEISDGFSSQWLKGLTVTGGDTLDQDVEVTLESE